MKRKRSRKRPPVELVPVRSPAPMRLEASGAYVRLPIAPELAEALRTHAENGARLVDLILGGSAAADEVVGQFVKTVAAVDRDLDRLREAARKRRQRRRRR